MGDEKEDEEDEEEEDEEDDTIEDEVHREMDCAEKEERRGERGDF